MGHYRKPIAARPVAHIGHLPVVREVTAPLPDVELPKRVTTLGQEIGSNMCAKLAARVDSVQPNVA